MPRHARIVIPDVPVHLIQRGHNRHACFFRELDYEYYLHWLTLYASEFECDVHAYALMTNHVHMAITPHARDALWRLMKKLNQHYVGYINKYCGRTGTLWEGRFRSCLLLEPRYFVTCMRYIELNPVRAGMVDHPGDYPWSSYRSNAGGKPDPCITPHAHYLAFGGTEVERQIAYRAYVAAHQDDAMLKQIRRAAQGNYALGNEDDVIALAQTLGQRITPAKRGRPSKQN